MRLPQHSSVPLRLVVSEVFGQDSLTLLTNAPTPRKELVDCLGLLVRLAG